MGLGKVYNKFVRVFMEGKQDSRAVRLRTTSSGVARGQATLRSPSQWLNPIGNPQDPSHILSIGFLLQPHKS